ncbi:MAG: flagellar hook assembly protein FlgD [Ectothiorhodospira sp.]
MSAIDPSMLQKLGLTGASSGQESGKKQQDELGQEDFLEMMITQMKNQDPFKPMESEDFLGQIAQFSTVNGITEMQQSFEEIAGSMQSNQTLQAANLVDREVLVPVDLATLGTQGGVEGALDLERSSPEVTVNVYDQAGSRVKRIPMGSQPEGLGTFRWDGTTDSGERAPPGIYEFRAQAQGEDGNVQPQTLLNARVNSVRSGKGEDGVTLQVDGFGEIGLSEVRRIG